MFMKARLPRNYSNKGAGNMQQLALQAQKIQEQITEATEELKQKEYKASSGGGAVEVVVNGDLEVKSISLDPQIIDPEESEMLSDLVIAAVNEALREAINEKDQVIGGISDGLNVPGLF